MTHSKIQQLIGCDTAKTADETQYILKMTNALGVIYYQPYNKASPKLQCLCNLHHRNKNAVLQAAAETSSAVEWRATPDESMPKHSPSYKSYGSIWSAQTDLSAFWQAYQRLTLY